VRRRNIEMVAAAAAHNNREREREKNRCIIKYITKHTDRPELFQSPRSLSLFWAGIRKEWKHIFVVCVLFNILFFTVVARQIFSVGFVVCSFWRENSTSEDGTQWI
jgi:hypothetical protein